MIGPAMRTKGFLVEKQISSIANPSKKAMIKNGRSTTGFFIMSSTDAAQFFLIDKLLGICFIIIPLTISNARETDFFEYLFYFTYKVNKKIMSAVESTNLVEALCSLRYKHA